MDRQGDLEKGLLLLLLLLVPSRALQNSRSIIMDFPVVTLGGKLASSLGDLYESAAKPASPIHGRQSGPG